MTSADVRTAGAWLPVRLAALVLVVYGVAEYFGPADSDVIEVTPLIIEELAQRREALVGRILTEVEREAVIESYVEEELLIREALRQGLDRGDVPIRTLLIGDARAELLRSVGYEPPTPERDELARFYAQSSERYHVPERVDFEQVAYSAGTEPSAPEEVLRALRAGADFTGMGDALPTASAAGVSPSELSSAYGVDFSRTVFALELGEWHGPLASPVGIHFVRVSGKTLGRERGFDEVEPYVSEDYQLDAAARALDEAMKPLRRRYLVSIEE